MKLPGEAVVGALASLVPPPVVEVNEAAPPKIELLVSASDDGDVDSVDAVEAFDVGDESELVVFLDVAVAVTVAVAGT